MSTKKKKKKKNKRKIANRKIKALKVLNWLAPSFSYVRFPE